MSEMYIKGKWKLKAPKKIPKSTALVIGMVYQGTEKFFGKKVIGVLVEMFDQNDEAVLRTIEGKLISVDKKSLKIVVSE